MSMRKISHIFDLRSSRNPQNRQVGHHRYVWDQPRSVTSDGLWKVKIQWQRSDVVMFWPKSCIISPFPLIAASCVAENTIFMKKSVGGCTTYDVIALWPDLTRSISPPKLRKWCPISSAKFQRNPPSGLAVAMGGCITPPPARARVNVRGMLKIRITIHKPSFWHYLQAFTMPDKYLICILGESAFGQ